MTIDDGIDPTQKQNYLSDAEFVEVRRVLHANAFVQSGEFKPLP